MRTDATGWLAAAAARAEPAGEGPGLSSLSEAQRRELRRMSAVAVASSALFVAALGMAWAPIHGRPLTSVAVLAPAPPAAPQLAAGLVAQTERPSGARRRSLSPSRPLLPARAIPAAPRDSVLTLAALRTPAKRPSRISRLLIGSGRYRIQPFPTFRTSSPDDPSAR